MLFEFGALGIIIVVLVAAIWYLFSFIFTKIGIFTDKATQHFKVEGDKNNDEQFKSNKEL